MPFGIEKNVSNSRLYATKASNLYKTKGDHAMIKRTTTNTAVNQTANLKEASTQSEPNRRVKQQRKPDAYVPARIPHRNLMGRSALHAELFCPPSFRIY